MERKRINIDGQGISYLEKGAKGKETFLFLHGWGCDAEIYRPIIDKLGDKHIISLDFPGFGESQEPHDVWGVRDYAVSLEKFITLNKLKNITLVGHSFGGRVTFWLYSLGKELPINRIVLTGAAGIKPKRTIKYYLSVGSYKFKKFLVKTPFYFQYKEDLFANAGSSDYKSASEQMKKVFIRVVNEDLRPLIKNINVPTKLFWGESDDATPVADGYLMEKEISDCQLEVVKGSHYAFLEYQDAFLEMVKNK